MNNTDTRWSRVLRALAPSRTALFMWMPFYPGVWRYFRIEQPRGGRR